MISELLAEKKDELIRVVNEWKNSGKSIIFWGTGNTAREIVPALLKRGIEPECFCDNNATDQDGLFGNRYSVKNIQKIMQEYKNIAIILTLAINNAIPVLKQIQQISKEIPVMHISNPFKVDFEFLDIQTMEKDMKAYELVYESWEDEYSRELFLHNLHYKMSGNIFPLLPYEDEDESFFDKNLIQSKDNYFYIDVGAYTGDTILQFYGFSGGRYKKIVALEPDQWNFEKMKQFVEFGRFSNIELLQMGAWDKKDELVFNTINNDISYDNPNFYKNARETISREQYNEGVKKNIEFSSIEVKVNVDRLDDKIEITEPGLIKINALGADFPALVGCEGMLKKIRPIVVTEYATRPDYITQMPLYLKRIRPEYKLFLRQKRIFGDSKTVLYAI